MHPTSKSTLLTNQLENFFRDIILEDNKLKYKSLVEYISNAILSKRLKEGEMLPSVNQCSDLLNISRDTVYKAYSLLKKQELIESLPNRGYFVSKNKDKVFLLLDTFKSYKEVLYHSFRENLNDNIAIDIRFHHYNIDVFEMAVNQAIGKYSKYIIMNFDNKKIQDILIKIPKEKLLNIDWNIQTKSNISKIYQDFGIGVYNSLQENLERIKKYKKFVFLYPEFTYHPKITLEYFEKFCKDNFVDYQIVYNTNDLDVKAGQLYFLVSDRTLAMFLDQCMAKGLQVGKNAGVISYNETPMKKYVQGGITVISTDFKQMGKLAADFVNFNSVIDKCIPTKILLRNSL